MARGTSTCDDCDRYEQKQNAEVDPSCVQNVFGETKQDETDGREKKKETAHKCQ